MDWYASVYIMKVYEEYTLVAGKVYAVLNKKPWVHPHKRPAPLNCPPKLVSPPKLW